METCVAAPVRQAFFREDNPGPACLELELLPARRQYRAGSSIVKRKKYSQMKSRGDVTPTVQGAEMPGYMT